jgi:signal transduction histidine kinase
MCTVEGESPREKGGDARAEVTESAGNAIDVLRQTAYALSFAGDEAGVRWVTVRAAADALRTSRAALLGIDGDVITILADFDETGLDLRGLAMPVKDHPGVAEVLASGEPWAGRLDGARWPPRSAPRLRGIRTGALAPVPWNGEIQSVLVAVSREEREFGYRELELLQELAVLCPLALNATQRYRSEHEYGARMAALERAKTEFLNLASHELRGPLSVISGYLSMLNEGALGVLPPAADNVTRLLAAKATEMNVLVNDMLEVARLEDGRMELSIERFDLRSIVSHVVDDWRPLAPEGLTIHVEEDGRPVSVDADVNRVRTIVTNLLSNAMKYSPDGGDVVCGVAEREDRALLLVTDHGLGIPEDGLPALFTRFGRIVTPETSHIPGTGLGLYVSRELALAQGGDLSVATELGKGSTFTLSLPRSRRRPRVKAPAA